MDQVKFILFSVVVLILLVSVGYWAFNTLQTGSEYELNQEVKRLEQENEELENEIESLSEELAVFKSKYPDSPAEPVENITSPEAPAPSTTATTYKYEELINELQDLIDDNIHMKLKSRGSRVGTIQEFLNIYNNTSKRIDNDYGEGTKTSIIAFQKDQGLTADGEAGPSTFKKMIEWLKKQG